jgi:CheY-like chemotaxis protein
MIDFKGKLVLVVDDEPDYVETIADEYQDLGCQVLKAFNGQEALELVAQHPKIDLIVSDIRMPKMDGVELLTKIKDMNPATPVIIFITGHSDLKINQAYDLGADSIFSKPFKMQQLIDTSNRLLTPLSERLISPMAQSPEESLNIVEVQQLAIGRGGLSFCAQEAAVNVGQRITFDMHHQGTHFKGQGIVRWVCKKNLLLNGQHCLGLEFFYLAPEVLQQVCHRINQTPIRAYIPAVSCQEDDELTDKQLCKTGTG